ncbi:MAG: MBL fold metallo-hydrolase, partial [Xanthobacteraceae bacterium]
MRFTRRRLITGLSAMAAAAGGLASVRAAHARYYEGALSDHFDGLRFVDPHGMAPKGIPDLLRWWTARGRITWSDWVPSPYADEPPARIDGRALRMSFIGHASLLVQTAGLNILIDPVWSKRASPVRFAGPARANPPGIVFEDLPPIDVVLVTHNHYDHLDTRTLSRLRRAHEPRIVAPLGNDAVVAGADPSVPVETFDWGQAVALSDGITAHLEPANHWSARGLNDRRMALWCAYVLTTPAGVIYHVGDTGYGDGAIFRRVRERFGAPRLA